LDALEDLHRQYHEQVAFFVVYIKEAHPEDGWVLGRNRRADVRVSDATTVEGREHLKQLGDLVLWKGAQEITFEQA